MEPEGAPTIDYDSGEEIEYEPEDVEVCGQNLSVTTVSFMPLSQLMKLGGKGPEVSGQKLWCGSVCLSEYLHLSGFSLVRGARVVELGAGTGVAGMLCARFGAARVWVTDHDVKCIKHMTEDLARNGIEAGVVRLDWFLPIPTAFIDELAAQAEVPLVIIAGDVLYKSVLAVPFFTTAKNLLGLHPEAYLILCHIPRADVRHEFVVQTAQDLGLCVDKQDDGFRERVDTDLCPKEDVDRAHVYVITLKKDEINS
jgi:predicted nicotinamide N-methyase